jgi:hypothetical protein
MKGVRINKHVVFYEEHFHRNFHNRNFKALSLPDLNKQIKQFGIDKAFTESKMPTLIKLDSYKGVHTTIYHDPETLFNYYLHEGLGVLTPAHIPSNKYYLPSKKKEVKRQLMVISDLEKHLALAKSNILTLTL